MMKELVSSALSCLALLFLGPLLDNVGVVRADNPIVQTFYSADPAPVVYNDRLYVFLVSIHSVELNLKMLTWDRTMTTMEQLPT